MLFGKKRRAAEAAERQTTRPTFESRGWRWEDAAPPPALEITEAALRARRGHRAIWPIGMSEVASGDAHGYAATAARLVGYEFATTNSGTPLGRRAETNVVWMSLPQVLPEIRFGDATLPDRDDTGVRLPPVPRSGAGPSARWSVEGFIPAFAGDLLTPAFIGALEAAPARTPVVIRAGVILTYGSETLSTDAVDARLALLATLLHHVPEAAWGRADALVSGTGVSPKDAPDGPALRLDERLVSRDWQGYGLQKVDWREAPTAEGSVMLKHRDAVDLWPTDAAASPGISAGIRLGGIPLTPTPSAHGIPTVAATVRGD